MHDAPDTDRGIWWGAYDVPPGEWIHYEIGPLSLYARAMRNEWRFAWRSAGDPLDARIAATFPSEAPPGDADYDLSRYALLDPGPGLHLHPRLADLPVVVNPETPLYLLPSQHAVLYVSTVAWVSVCPRIEAAVPLLEIPVHRPSDTWFGPTTLSGELCYASSTSARTQVESLDRLTHRAITPVDIRNEGQDVLRIEQLRIPVEALTLYAADGRLWTDAVSFVRESGEAQASLDVLSSSEYLPSERAELAPPRMPMRAKSVVDAFSRLFG